MSQQFISFKLKAVSLKEGLKWYFINTRTVRLVKMTEHRIDIFDDQANITIDKADHPEAYEAIRHFLLNNLEGNYSIIEENPEDPK